MATKKAKENDPLLDRMTTPEENVYPPAFVLKNPGDFVIGVIERFVSVNHPTYGPYPVVVLNVEQAKADVGGDAKPPCMGSVHVVHHVMRNQLVRLNVAVGERIGIRRFQDRESASGNRYANYTVARASDGPEGTGGSFAESFDPVEHTGETDDDS